MTFEQLNLIPAILKALQDENYTSPTDIQSRAIPLILDGHDVLGSAQTGTGKTAAFAIPIIQHLELDEDRAHGRRKILSLIVTPTRELAIQIGESFDTYGKYTNVKTTVVFGGVSHRQLKPIPFASGVDVLVATPGRFTRPDGSRLYLVE